MIHPAMMQLSKPMACPDQKLAESTIPFEHSKETDDVRECRVDFRGKLSSLYRVL
jgi:hypothetical protein